MNTRNRDFDKRPKGQTCGTCNGNKEIMVPTWVTGTDGRMIYKKEKCPDCGGTGLEK